jgi:hypothetical protein
VINAVLYEDGKVPEERERFTIVVMGFNSTGKRDFKSEVGISSRGQDELVAARMFRLISSDVAGAKRSSEGGGEGGGMCAVWEFRVGENLEHSFIILSLKKLRNEEAMMDVDINVGRMG